MTVRSLTGIVKRVVGQRVRFDMAGIPIEATIVTDEARAFLVSRIGKEVWARLDPLGRIELAADRAPILEVAT